MEERSYQQKEYFTMTGKLKARLLPSFLFLILTLQDQVNMQILHTQMCLYKYEIHTYFSLCVCGVCVCV